MRARHPRRRIREVVGGGAPQARAGAGRGRVTAAPPNVRSPGDLSGYTPPNVLRPPRRSLRHISVHLRPLTRFRERFFVVGVLISSVPLLVACRKGSSETADASALGRGSDDARPKGSSAFRSSTKLDSPEQCRTALLETKSCRGEDSSFQECHYYFRAEGVPRTEVCRAFANVPMDSAAPDAGDSECSETSPSAWKRIACGDYELPASFACFSCSNAQPEAARHLVQAFAPACDRAIVLKSCNVDLRDHLR